jgi:homoprotocatechuate degradation regulator HpaR
VADAQLPTDLPRAVREALEALVAPFRPLFAAHGLTEQQWRVLRAVRGGAESQVDLAAACVMHPASLTGVLARMERAGLVERRRSSADQRRIEVAIAPAGEALVERLAPEIAARYEDLGRRVGVATLRALEQAARALGEAAG